jgi:hypothetical protein
MYPIDCFITTRPHADGCASRKADGCASRKADGYGLTDNS